MFMFQPMSSRRAGFGSSAAGGMSVLVAGSTVSGARRERACQPFAGASTSLSTAAPRAPAGATVRSLGWLPGRGSHNHDN